MIVFQNVFSRCDLLKLCTVQLVQQCSHMIIFDCSSFHQKIIVFYFHLRVALHRIKLWFVVALHMTVGMFKDFCLPCFPSANFSQALEEEQPGVSMCKDTLCKKMQSLHCQSPVLWAIVCILCSLKVKKSLFSMICFHCKRRLKTKWFYLRNIWSPLISLMNTEQEASLTGL